MRAAKKPSESPKATARPSLREATGSPFRVQLSRRKGWRKPPNTVVVSKPSMWGNPFWEGYGCRISAAWAYRLELEIERTLMRIGAPALNRHMRRIAEHLHELRGKNLACWCPTDMPDCYCHAGVLLELANAPAHRPALERNDGKQD